MSQGSGALLGSGIKIAHDGIVEKGSLYADALGLSVIVSAGLLQRKVPPRRYTVCHRADVVDVEITHIPGDAMGGKNAGSLLVVYTATGQQSYNLKVTTGAKVTTQLNPYLSQIRARAAANAAPPPAAPAPDLADQIRKLAEFRDQGILTVEEFEAKKSELLARHVVGSTLWPPPPARSSSAAPDNPKSSKHGSGARQVGAGWLTHCCSRRSNP